MAGDEWTTLPFDEAPVEIIDGDRGKNYPKMHEFSESGYCLFLNTGNVTKDGFDFSNCKFITQEKDVILRKGKLKRQDVVMTTRGTVGNVAYYDAAVPYEHVRINSGMVIFRSDTSRVNPRYLYFFLRSSTFANRVLALRTGSAQPQLPIRDINRIEVPLPPLKQQQAIACILGALDDKIELNRRMNQTLEAMARAIFKSWFVDFLPVRAKQRARTQTGDPVRLPAEALAQAGAKAEGQQPPLSACGHAQAGGLAPHIANLFPDAFEESDLGEIPRGWDVRPIGDVVKVLGGGTPSTKEPPSKPSASWH
ncbi:MAG: restriction endonuclease subunit S [Deltaproteobacteria bacterium]|nr:restriction endonuclease subunit S [Deltaproteobacteria bacterium]